MRVDKLTLERIFERTERLEAPLFQRPYVWKEHRNSVPLWEAIKKVAAARLAGVPGRPCFLGAIVLDQLKTSTGKLHARQIIDGQQRLTTLQLAIAAARDLCAEREAVGYSEAFKKLNTNHVPLSKDPDELFKVWPTNSDRSDFRDTMKAGSREAVKQLPAADPDDEWLIPNAYLFFADTLNSWLGEEAGESLEMRLDALYFAIKEDLHLVVIDLEEQDDAQVIFETLNALGTPLLPTDLVKNYLFHLAEYQSLDTQQLYQKYWASFDTDKHFWRQEVRQGRLKRSRLDLFMNDYLTLVTGEEVSAAVLFSTFRDYVRMNDGESAAKHMEAFRSYANIYRSFGEFAANSKEGQFFYRLEQLDTTTVFPLLLEVLKQFNNSKGRAELLQILGDLESFFVRRAICELTTKNYNRLFVDLIKSSRAKNDFSAAVVRDFLLSQTVDGSRWPDDEEFKASWLTINFYRRLKKSKARMILEAMEASMHSGKTEIVQLEKALTIEHLLPKEWEKHWALPENASTPDEIKEASKFRNEMLHKVGNLSLVTKRLNPALSNGPWLKKRDKILEHSALNMNRVFQNVTEWNEALIHTRSLELFRYALKIWPRPNP
jgi:uncharacterized protein with ParB-like and HNH nuclease domain